MEYLYKHGKRFSKDSHGDWVEALYTEGEIAFADSRIREIVSSGQTPAFKGLEHNFLQGRDNNQEFNRMPADMREFYLKRAKAGGVNPRGKVYISQLADDAGDPKAWVSSKHEVTAKANSKGLAAS